MLILKGYSSELVHCLPISHTKKNNKLFYRIKFDQIDGSALLSQLRPIDTLRLSTLITDIPNEMLADIKRAVANLILS